MEWIDVNDRLPEKAEEDGMMPVMVWLPTFEEYEFGYYNHVIKKWIDSENFPIIPSHWMPLPDPPAH